MSVWPDPEDFDAGLHQASKKRKEDEDDNDSSSSSESEDELEKGRIRAKRASLVRAAEKILADQANRRTTANQLMSYADNFPGMEEIRTHCLNLDQGPFRANPALTSIFTQVMPVVHQCEDDLSALRIQLSLLVSGFKKDSEANDQHSPCSPAGQFVVILKKTRKIVRWCLGVEEDWTSYHLSREKLARENFSQPNMQVRLEQQRSVQTCGLWKAVLELDCKMCSDLRSVLNTIQLNYSKFDELLLRAVQSLKSERSSLELQGSIVLAFKEEQAVEDKKTKKSSNEKLEETDKD